MTDESQVLREYSTASLKRNELTRAGKKQQLASLGLQPDDIRRVLDELFGAEAEESVAVMTTTLRDAVS